MQEDELKAHSHDITTKSSFGDHRGYIGGANSGGNTATASSSSYGGDETRPKNLGVNFFVKIYHNCN